MHSCSNSKKANNKESEPVFIIQQTACFGECPVYTMKIYRNGFVEYKGKMFVEKEGDFEKSISEDKVEDLINKFEGADFFSFEDKYTSNMTDLPTTFTTFNFDGKSKKVENYHGAPDELKELEKELRKIAESEDGWKKLAE